MAASPSFRCGSSSVTYLSTLPSSSPCGCDISHALQFWKSVERKRCFERLLPSSESVARAPIPSTERKFSGEETSYGFRAENCERRRRDWFSLKQLRVKAQGLAGQNRDTASEGGGIGFPRNNCERRRRDWQGRIATLRVKAQGLVKSKNAVF